VCHTPVLIATNTSRSQDQAILHPATSYQLPGPSYHHLPTATDTSSPLDWASVFNTTLPREATSSATISPPHLAIISSPHPDPTTTNLCAVTCSVQSVKQITARFHQISDAGCMAVQLAVKHYFGEDVMVSSSVVLVNYNFNWIHFSMAFLKFS